MKDMQIYRQGKLIVIYGRRRVGKTELVQKFISAETFYYFMITTYHFLSISQTIYVVLASPEQIKKSLSAIEKSLYLYIDYAPPLEVLVSISNDISRQSGDFVRFRDWDTLYSYFSSRGGTDIR